MWDAFEGGFESFGLTMACRMNCVLLPTHSYNTGRQGRIELHIAIQVKFDGVTFNSSFLAQTGLRSSTVIICLEAER